MCSYITEKVTLKGSAKSGDEWFSAQEAVVYYDHPYFTTADHTLNVDIHGKDRRVAFELTAESARALCAAIELALARSTH